MTSVARALFVGRLLVEQSNKLLVFESPHLQYGRLKYTTLLIAALPVLGSLGEVVKSFDFYPASHSA